jgi:hypothetical protein
MLLNDDGSPKITTPAPSTTYRDGMVGYPRYGSRVRELLEFLGNWEDIKNNGDIPDTNETWLKLDPSKDPPERASQFVGKLNDWVEANKDINGNTTAYSKLDTKHTLKRDMAYFVYWLIMNYPFIEDAGYPSQNMRISNSLSTIWGRTIIRDGYYNDTDREFLNHVKDWLKENNWVYKKIR